MNYLQSNNNRYRHHFCIFAKYRINMKREILYQKIAGTIAWQIKTGIWKAGEKLPSLRTISNEYGVSLNTAIQVYYELEKEGFIISRIQTVTGQSFLWKAVSTRKSTMISIFLSAVYGAS